MRKWPSEKQGECPHQTPDPASQSWTSQPPELLEIMFVIEASPVLHVFVIAAQAKTLTY